MGKSYKIAMGGMVSALAVLCLFLTGFIPIGTYVLPTIAGSILLFMALEFSPLWSYLTFLVISILALMITPDREAALLFIAFFGHYPTTKLLLERIPAKGVVWLCKMLLFNLSMILSYSFMIHLMGLDAILEEFGEWGAYGIWLFLLVGNFIFIMIDVALSRVKSYYLQVVRKKLKRSVRG